MSYVVKLIPEAEDTFKELLFNSGKDGVMVL